VYFAKKSEIPWRPWQTVGVFRGKVGNTLATLADGLVIFAEKWEIPWQPWQTAGDFRGKVGNTLATLADGLVIFAEKWEIPWRPWRADGVFREKVRNTLALEGKRQTDDPGQRGFTHSVCATDECRRAAGRLRGFLPAQRRRSAEVDETLLRD
jgi:hypothetical protein